MLPEIVKLLVIQHKDQNIEKLNKQIARIPLEEEDIRDRISNEKQAEADALADVQEIEIAIKNIELDVQTRRDSIAKLKVQQFQTKKNDEFQAMTKEIERYEEEIATLEDGELEEMEKLEDYAKVLTEARSQLTESQQNVEDDIADLHKTRDNLKSEKDSETVEREEKAAELDTDLLENYDRIFKAKNGKAVVGLVDMQCSGCHMKVVKSTVVDVKAENDIAYCENCGRMLYYWTDESDNEQNTSNQY